MATPQAIHHALLRPCILHILRAAGYHSTKPSVLDTLTDIAAKYIILLAQSTASHAANNHPVPALGMGISIQDIRMAMEDCAVLLPEKSLVEQEMDGEEDTAGVDEFLAWATGPGNREIRRIALEGDATKEDYLTALKKKHSTADEDTRYNGTILGKPAEVRAIKVEGGDITSIHEWRQRLMNPAKTTSTSTVSSRRQSSALSSLGDATMEDMEF